ncbi:ornithine cyclodeaminase family protein [Leucobacter rhizosphaerae]|uniref:Ornithine cyclodeaminase family protein n=1 Tax=Leucobacter rhizosphaerae TaxID=2932245 RepID=A0ABY4FYD6_9MICO|nr:ornithine cyclodeaminase family protein [Leucobacter rhizosphaerae]UOQ61316.1 ornithine cyclodeaminase family protein [Leucobacter rhizosphaerae]
MPQIPFLDAAAVRRALPAERAMQALDAALRTEIDPEVDAPRLFSPAPHGEFLLMPAQGPEFSGLKALTVAPGNPARNLPKIQGLYLLIDSDSLAPVAILEGSSLTAIRTAAVTLTAIRYLAAAAPATDRPPARPEFLVIGAGVQAESHIRAARAALPGAEFTVAGRRPERVAALRAALGGDDTRALDPAPGALDRAVAEADVILCVTSSDTPVFDGSLVRGGAIVAAVGTHGRDRREVDDRLVARADLLVEGRRSAERENGNLATALGPADWAAPSAPRNLREAALGRLSRRPGHPALYTGVGMSWEDLVCAAAAFTASTSGRE